MEKEKPKTMIQVSVSIREDKHEFLKKWADDRDESMATICRGWIYTGLADLHDSLYSQGMLDRFLPQEEVAELEIPDEPQTEEQPNERPDEGSVGDPVVH